MKISQLLEQVAAADIANLAIDEPLYEDSYNFLDLKFKFKSNSAALLRWLARSYACFSGKTESTDVEFAFIEKGPFGAHLAFISGSSTHLIYKTGNGIITIYCENKTPPLKIAYLGEKAKRELSWDQVEIISGDENGQDLFGIADLLVTIAIAALPKQCLFFHAACLSGNNGGIILAGETMNGKTTLSLGLAYRGYALLSDEITALKLDSGDILPFPKSLQIREDSLNFIRPLMSKKPELGLNGSEKGRRLVSCETLGVRTAKTACQPTHFFLLQGFKKQPKASPALPREALWYAMASSYAKVSGLPQSLLTIGAIFARLKCYRLWQGQVKETVDLIQGLVMRDNQINLKYLNASPL
ncbi:MAG: hypothetical protein HZA78_00485 [Candidatus Schekmanbacteria bacterium]|nr:hypothetical protein [Candidatus Schekmanbacteria bacterium]